MNMTQLNGFIVTGVPELSTIDLIVHNIDYAVKYTIEGILYYMIGTNIYLIEKYILNVQLRAVDYQ